MLKYNLIVQEKIYWIPKINALGPTYYTMGSKK